MTVLKAYDSGAAYDYSQCHDDWQEAGQVFEVEGKPIVGVTYTWPFVITKDRGGCLHQIEEHPSTWEERYWGVFEDRGSRAALIAGVDAAIAYAKEKGYELDDWLTGGK